MTLKTVLKKLSLPWVARMNPHDGTSITKLHPGGKSGDHVHIEENQFNHIEVRYLCHAANNLPKLVEILESIVNETDETNLVFHRIRARNLLDEVNEIIYVSDREVWNLKK